MTLHGHNLYCPLLSMRQKDKEEVWHGICTEEHCAWWAGEECAITKIAKVLSGQQKGK